MILIKLLGTGVQTSDAGRIRQAANRFCDGGAVDGYLRIGLIAGARFKRGFREEYADERVHEQLDVTGLVMAIVTYAKEHIQALE
ncbi:hypothetical protein [Janthinobacterium psychrotolerans]|uniref:hypothetical protein n=1 Tax=Janthinobacterium psychrotolerans TaxID=1747903 RepID=UPI0008067A36|nr:hypothetical protein [Janthinobacterium psychrotolerans]